MEIFKEDKKKFLCRIDGRMLKFIKNPTKEDYINGLKSRRTFEASQLIPPQEFKDKELIEIALTYYLRTFESIPHEYISQEIVDRSFLNCIKYFKDPLNHIPFIPMKFLSSTIQNVKKQIEKYKMEEIEERKRIEEIEIQNYKKREYIYSFINGNLFKKKKF